MTNLHPTPDNFWSVDDNRIQTNEHKAREAGLEPCSHCGKGVAPGKGFLVTIVDGGTHIAHPNSPEAANDTDPGYMGSWLLGATCAKNIPAAFKTRT